MSMLELLRRCIMRERVVLDVFERSATDPGWRSDERMAPREEGLVVFGCRVDGDDEVWTPFRLQVGDIGLYPCSPYLLCYVPPRQVYALVVPARVGVMLPPTTVDLVTVELLGWILNLQ